MIIKNQWWLVIVGWIITSEKVIKNKVTIVKIANDKLRLDNAVAKKTYKTVRKKVNKTIPIKYKIQINGLILDNNAILNPKIEIKAYKLYNAIFNKIEIVDNVKFKRKITKITLYSVKLISLIRFKKFFFRHSNK